MQFDFFSNEAVAINGNSPPMVVDGVLRLPETALFEMALRNGDLSQALKIINRLNTTSAWKVLLGAGFTVTSNKNRVELMSGVQKDLIEASRLKLTGYELRKHKENTLFLANNINSPTIVGKETENDNSNDLQSESLSNRDSRSGDGNGANGSRDRQSLDAGLGEESAAIIRSRNLSGVSEQPVGARERNSSERSITSTFSSARDYANVRDSGISTELESSALDEAPEDYVISANGNQYLTLGQKFRINIRTIEIIKELDLNKRHATESERDILAQYVGWGGLKGVFDPNNKQWEKQYTELKALLTDEEYAAARRSQLDSHYTSPVIINAMYGAANRLGFKDGRILEPSVGVGAFYGVMPKAMRNNSSLHGVELDLLSSKITSHLYPSAKIAQATGFQDYAIPAGYFDMVIGNPPFGGQVLADQKGSTYSGWSIHNYFFAKSIEMLRPGGIMPMVVSHSFLDKLDPHVRQWISRRAELVSGVRLPNTAFKDNANSEVVTDILLFKRLDTENMLGNEAVPEWLNTSEVSLQNQDTGEFSLSSVNDYFLKNPQNVLGTPVLANTMYQANTYTVAENGDLETLLAEWVETLPVGIYEPLIRTAVDLDKASIEIPDGVKEGSFFATDNKVYRRLPDNLGEKQSIEWDPPNQKALERMLGMIKIREVLRAQIYMERTYLVSSTSDVELERHRHSLDNTYEQFKQKYGYLNDPVNRRLFIDDTESALIQALEFDYEKAIGEVKAEELGISPRPSQATKADILSRRVLFPPVEVANVENAKDALLHSLNLYGRVNMDFMTEAYHKSEQDIIDELGNLLYTDPVYGLVTRDAYLSGDVKTKLAEAIKAAESDSSFKKNVEALSEIIPVDKLPSEIFASIGGIWIPTDIYKDFLKEISGGDATFNHLSVSGQWLMSDPNNLNYGKNSTEFGTDKMGASQILFAMMNSRGLEVKKRILVDGFDKYVTDEEATEAVRQRGDKIRSHWDSWLWADSDRAMRIAGIYNDRFNRSVERKYDGSHLTFPGMNPSIQLLGHQKNGVWRGLQDRVMLADQVVGAGKTFELAAMAMEMRRLGIAKKPMFAVPNHLTLQWRSEFYRLYPGANVLAATPQDFDKENREKLFSKIVTGNWDAVIIGHSSLKKLGIPKEAEIKIYKEQLDEMLSAIAVIKSERGDRNIIRDMEKIASNLESKLTLLNKKAGEKDNVVNFEDMGVDALYIDEIHEFKNLFFHTQMQRVAGLGNPAGSGKAFDLFIKVRWLQETFGENAPLITATGTPVSNSLAEMFTMQRFMQYNTLKRDGLHMFDSWAKQYGDVQTVYEVAPSGTGYRLSQRFAKFKNLSSLMSEYRSFADVVTLDDLKDQETMLGRKFPVPKIKGGRPLNVVAKRTELQEAFFGVPEIKKNEYGIPEFEANLDLEISINEGENGKWELKREYSSKVYETREAAEEALVTAATTPKMIIDPDSIVGQFENLKELTRKTKGKINALSLTSLANKAGLDYRLINPNAVDHPGTKLNLSIQRMLAIHEKWGADKGTQLVFCDLSVPLSAKAKMASNEKRIYVRDDKDELTHKKGTLHAPKNYEGFPYFLVVEGKGKDRLIAIYDSITGAKLKTGLENKQAAHDFVTQFLEREDGQERWLDLRDKSRLIESEEIDDYKNTHSISEDGDSVDFEITAQDIEGVTGVTAFSVYDDIKAKLIRNGIPANQIEFIHDHDTPQAKDALFKRVNAGDVRFLLGSTPKMGAGTNVQKRLVALHHIDAPWRPSDLEQREGRIIRRGNILYDRDPDNFEVEIIRYSTSQTYDTRRWQLLEHKASGVDQLRKYSGENEIDDVTSEASNSADMKAAASGNPLILKETQLATEVKKLRALARAHIDGEYVLNSRFNNANNYVNQFGPAFLAEAIARKTKRDTAESLAIYKGVSVNTKEELLGLVKNLSNDLSAKKAESSIVYRGLEFVFSRDNNFSILMYNPDNSYSTMVELSHSGVVTRMENWVNGVDERISLIEARIDKSKAEAIEMKSLMGKPFSQEAELASAISEHGKVQRELMKANSAAAIKPEERATFNAALIVQKDKLIELGFGEAVRKLGIGENLDVVIDGSYIGKIESHENGIIVQNIGRGETVKHDVSRFELIPSIGDVVTIRYDTDRVRVDGQQQSISR